MTTTTYTFGQYLDESISVADEDADIETMRADFRALIEPYGFTLDDTIPPNFYDTLRKTF